MKVRVLYPSAFAARGFPDDKDVIELADFDAEGLIAVGFAEEVKSKAIPKPAPRAPRKKAE